MKKQIVITKLFEFGGSNAHLKNLLKYFGEKNTILLLEDKAQNVFLDNMRLQEQPQVRIIAGIHQYAHLSYPSSLSCLKELYRVISSMFRIFFFSLRYGLAGVTINTVEPEKYLYLLCIPFLRITYILHSTPPKRHTVYTTFICNYSLGQKKNILTVSAANKKLICTNWEISARKSKYIKVVHNCLNDPLPGTASELLKKDYILTLGHVVAYKNPGIWLETAKKITRMYNSIEFIWLGNGPLWHDFKTATAGFENISFPGAVSDPGPYLAGALIYYQPSLEETHGIAVVEAMSNYLPSVVSNTGGLPETIKHRYNGLLVEPQDTGQHVAALAELIENHALRTELGKNAYQRYQELFSFDTFQKKMNEIYRN